MVVVKHGALPPPGKQFKVYLNVDKLKQKWYLRVTHTYPQYNQHFRAGTYKSKEEAMEALKNLDPVNPKKGRQRKGTVDQYNGQWRVRAKHRGEHMHVGYFKDRQKAEQRLKEVIADTEFLEKRYNSLLAKRKRKRESMNQAPIHALAKLKKIEQRQKPKMRMAEVVAGRSGHGYYSVLNPLPRYSIVGKDERSAAAFSSMYKPRPSDPIYPPPFVEPFSRRYEHDQSETENHLLAVAAWQRMQHGYFHSSQMQLGTEVRDGLVAQSSEEHCTSKKKKVRIRKRCLSCSKTQIIQAGVYALDSDPRLVYVQCESCKNEPVDVGWCDPATVQDNTLNKELKRTNDSTPEWCDPRHFKFRLKAPINYSD